MQTSRGECRGDAFNARTAGRGARRWGISDKSLHSALECGRTLGVRVSLCLIGGTGQPNLKSLGVRAAGDQRGREAGNQRFS
jgi:hypothetical protein